MLTTCIVEKRLLDGILDYCRKALPNESCAAVIGNVRNNACHVSGFHPLANISLSAENEFEADSSAWVRLLYQIGSSPKEIVGVLHSHPRHRAVPSSTDLNSLWYTLPTHWIISFADLTDNSGPYPEVAVYQYLFQQNSAAVRFEYKQIPLTLI